MPHRLIRTLAGLVLAASVPAQVDATFATFGVGCPGTGSGLDTAISILPAYMSSRFGSGNSIPFGWTPTRYQQLLPGADLPNALTMAGLSLRQAPRTPIANRYTVDLEIAVAYTTRTPATMSASFATNLDSGPLVVVLPRTQVTLPDMVPTGPTSPADFFVTIPWINTFDWVPAPGRNLLVQVTVFGNSYGGIAVGYGLDMASGSTIGRLYSNSPTATSGALEPGLGLVLGIRALTQTALPVLYSTNTPQIGDSFRVRFSQARPSSSTFVFLGFSSSAWSGIALPMDLGWLGAPGCSLLVSIDDVQSISTNAAGTGSFSYDLPNSIYLLRARLYNQGMIFDPTANGLGFAFTNGGVGVIGNQ